MKSRSNEGQTPGPALAEYLDRVGKGELEPDAAQNEAVVRLDRLACELRALRPAAKGLFSMFARAPKLETPRGLYIYGGVGRGKTMLMDLFYGSVELPAKRRIHFHEFMGEAHERIAAARKSVEGDPIPKVAEAFANEAALLCFDELHVTDIADAMILGRLFKRLLEAGTVVVATSNARPEDLYKNGLNRQLFVPFIDLIEDHLDVMELEAQKDFRLDKLVGHPLYFCPADKAARTELDRHWQRLTGKTPGRPTAIHVHGRQVDVPIAAMGVARFTFADLCARPLGASDYLQIARTFHTLIVENIPTMGPAERNEARRFINLIDALYDNRVGLIASAAAQPDDLCTTGDSAELFQRTASRLMEMRSESYLTDRMKRTQARHDLTGRGPK